MERAEASSLIDPQQALDFQIRIEGRIFRIYRRIALQFRRESGRETGWVKFWQELALDELTHALILSIAREFLRTGVRMKNPVTTDGEIQRDLDLLLSRCEEEVCVGMSRTEAINILVALEASEANRLFLSLLQGTESKVLTRFAEFSRLLREHERRILKGIRKYGSPAGAAHVSVEAKNA